MNTTMASADLWAALEAYLAQRRALGNQLVEEERHARRFLEWLLASTDTAAGFTVAQALRWAHGDGSLKASYQRQRLSAIRGLARYCLAIGLEVQVPATNALHAGRDRRRPHIFTQDEVDALIGACHHVFAHPLVRATMAAIIALLAVTGMRPGEALRLHTGDINAQDATLLVRANKHGPDRLIPLHPTTVGALTAYATHPHRQAVAPPLEGPLFVTIRGKAYQRGTVGGHFQRIRDAAGITWEGEPPCLRDLRHYVDRQVMRPAGLFGLVRVVLVVWLSA